MIPLSRPILGDAARAAVLRVLDSGMLAQGPEVAAFEDEFAATVGGGRCIAVNSGTSALHVALLAAGIGAGDEVIVPSFTFAASANSVALTGATPVFVDIEPKTFTMDPSAVRAAITTRTVAVMPVHLYGHPADMVAIAELAERHGLLILEDAAQAHLSSVNGRPVGSFGLAAFSFYPTKNMTTGECGMIVTGDAEVERRCRMLRNQGMEVRYENELVGLNNRMTDLQAALGRVQLESLPEWTTGRRVNAELYNSSLTGLATPATAPWAEHAWHQYTVRTPNRERLQAALTAAEIGSAVYYPIPVHRLPSFDSRLDLPETEAAAQEVLSIPVRPDLTANELDQIVEAVNGETGQW